MSVAYDQSSWNNGQYETRRRYSQEKCYSAKRKLTYPLYQHHITISYHHIQYTISGEEDLPTIPTSYHHQLPSHLILIQERRTYPLYHIISPSATITSSILFQERRTFRLTSYTNIISPSATITSDTISREEDLHPMPISYHHQLPSHPVYCFKRGWLTRHGKPNPAPGARPAQPGTGPG